MKYFVCFILLFPMFVASQGCSTPKPEGLPDLTPCTITLEQEGTPAAGVYVLFNPASTTNTGGFPIYGTTDSNGKLVVKTRELYNGIPAGDYIVTLTKVQQEGDEITDPAKVKIYTLVDPIYTDKQSSPLALTVGTEPIKQSWNIGKPQRVELKRKKEAAIP